MENPITLVLKKNNQKKKLSPFQRGKNKTPPTTPPLHEVHYFFDATLNQTTKNIVSKGFNFFITLKSIPIESIITQVQTAISHLPDNTAEEIRQEETVGYLRSS